MNDTNRTHDVATTQARNTAMALVAGAGSLPGRIQIHTNPAFVPDRFQNPVTGREVDVAVA